MDTFRARQTQEWWGREEFSAALALEGVGRGQEAGEGCWESVPGLHDAVLCDVPVHSVYDHSPHLRPRHSPWSSHQRPEVSHKYSSILMSGVPYVRCPQCHLSIPPSSLASVSEV